MPLITDPFNNAIHDYLNKKVSREELKYLVKASLLTYSDLKELFDLLDIVQNEKQLLLEFTINLKKHSDAHVLKKGCVGESLLSVLHGNQQFISHVNKNFEKLAAVAVFALADKAARDTKDDTSLSINSYNRTAQA